MVIFVHKCGNPNPNFECTGQWNTGRRDATVAKRLSIGLECKIDQRLEGEHGHQEREFMGHSFSSSLFCVDYESGC